MSALSLGLSVIIMPKSRVFGGLINFSVSGYFQELLSSFNPI